MMAILQEADTTLMLMAVVLDDEAILIHV